MGLLVLLNALTFTESVLDRESVPGAFERALLPYVRSARKASEASVVARYSELREGGEGR